MKLSELKAGMIIECHCGNKYLLVETKRELVAIAVYGWIDLNHLTEDMTSQIDPCWTIDKVYDIICPASLSSLLHDPIGILVEIWSRNEQ